VDRTTQLIGYEARDMKDGHDSGETTKTTCVAERQWRRTSGTMNGGDGDGANAAAPPPRADRMQIDDALRHGRA
jgi:hypothetical protein